MFALAIHAIDHALRFRSGSIWAQLKMMQMPEAHIHVSTSRGTVPHYKQAKREVSA